MSGRCCFLQQAPLSQNARHLLRILDRKADLSGTIAQRCDKNPVATRPAAVQRKPCPEIAGAPQPPASAENGRRTGLNTFDLAQWDVFVAAEGKIIAMKNDLMVGDFDEAVLV